MEHFSKVVYVWNEPQPLVKVPDRLRFESVTPHTWDRLISVVGQVMSASADRHDQMVVQKFGSREAAKRFISQADAHFVYELTWWQTAHDATDDLVGFLLPVVYPGEQKGNLEEATLYYIGVAPQHRGNGYAFDLLCQTTHVLQQVGVWRIYCDTDVENRAMINTFERVGYTADG